MRKSTPVNLPDREQRFLITSIGALVINLAYAVYNLYLGISADSVWFINLGAFYGVLSLLRFSLVTTYVYHVVKEKTIAATSALTLILLTLILTGTITMTLKFDNAESLGEIPMITIATFTTARVAIAIVNFVSARKNDSLLRLAICAINCSMAAVAVLTMQVSMFATFRDGDRSAELPLNIFTGALVCVTIISFAIYLLKKCRENRV